MGGFSSIFTGSNPTLNKDANNLGSLAGFSTGTGEKGTDAALTYDLGLLSGDPTKVAQTMAPETQQIQTQAQQNKNTVAQFGNRGGGMNAVMAGLDDATRAKLLSLAGGLRSSAAANAGSIGTANLGMAANDTNSQAKLAEQQQQNAFNSIFGKAISGGIGSLEGAAMPKLNKFLFGGGGAPPSSGAMPAVQNPDLSNLSIPSQPMQLYPV